MRAGRVVEQAPTEELFTRPRHDYTRQLLEAIPRAPAPPQIG
jgi:peptide/nickel transport system ATP-binding protein